MLNYSLWSLEFLVSYRFDSGHALWGEIKEVEMEHADHEMRYHVNVCFSFTLTLVIIMCISSILQNHC